MVVCFEQIPLRPWEDAEANTSGVDARSEPSAAPARYAPPGAASLAGPGATPHPAPAPANGTAHAMPATKPCTTNTDSFLRSLRFLCKTSGCVLATDVAVNSAPDPLPCSVTACHHPRAAFSIGNRTDRVIMWTVGLSAAVHLCGPPPDTSVLSARNAHSGSVRRGAMFSSGRSNTLAGRSCAISIALSMLMWTVFSGAAFSSGRFPTTVLYIIPAL